MKEKDAGMRILCSLSREEHGGDAENERRQYQRFQLQDLTTLQSRQGIFEAVVKDISKGGIRFEAEQILYSETPIRFNFNFFPIDFPLNCTVIWRREIPEGKFEYGAEFINLPRDKASLIQKHLETLRKKIFDSMADF